MRKREDENLNARQNATNPRSSAMRLDRETERDLYHLFQRYFHTAERERTWNLWNDIDWADTSAATPSPALVDAVLSLYRDALFLPDYHAAVLPGLRASRGRAWFWTRWSYEESKQILVLHEWLLKRGVYTEETLLAFHNELLGTSTWSPVSDDALSLFADTLVYELSKIERLMALETLATTEGDGALAKVAGLLCTDGIAHRDFLREALQRIGESYPEQLTATTQALGAGYASPTLAADLSSFIAA